MKQNAAAGPHAADRMNATEAESSFVAEMVSLVATETIPAVQIAEGASIAPVAIIERTIIVVIVAVINDRCTGDI